jgi:hypothetical protein
MPIERSRTRFEPAETSHALQTASAQNIIHPSHLHAPLACVPAGLLDQPIRLGVTTFGSDGLALRTLVARHLRVVCTDASWQRRSRTLQTRLSYALLPPGLSARRLQGRLTPLHTTHVGPNPAFIVRHPTLPHRLYATTECIVDNGELLTLELDRERGLVEVVARQSAVRTYPSYLPRTLASRARHSHPTFRVPPSGGDVRRAYACSVW